MPKPKIRKFPILRVSVFLIDPENLKAFIHFVPVCLKYYKFISVVLEDTDHYAYKNICFVFEKLQNLKSYSK